MRNFIAILLCVSFILSSLASGSVIAGDVKAYCKAEWPGDIWTQRECVRNDGADVFAHNTAKHKWRKFGRKTTTVPATKADAAIVQADQPGMPYAMGTFAGLLLLSVILGPAAPIPPVVAACAM